MAKQICDFVLGCSACLDNSSNNKEPRPPHEIPFMPWQKVVSDIFSFEGKDFFITFDYFSRFGWLVVLDLMVL